MSETVNTMLIYVTCAIIENQGKVLATQRSQKMNLPLKWEFPGGKIKFGESEKECLIREIYEELKIEIKPIRRLSPSIYHYSSMSIKLIPYVSKIISGEIMLLEHKQFLWSSMEELPILDWAEADIPIVKEYLSL